MFDRTKPYNELPVLPPKLKDGLSTEVLLLLAEATHSIGKLEGISKKLPNPLMLVNTIALREAKASSEIENIFTTDDELYKAISTTDSNISPAAKEVLLYRESLWHGIKDLRKGPIEIDTLIKVFQKIKDTKANIRPEHINTRIIKGGNSISSGEVVYTPPKGEVEIKSLLINLIDFINNYKTLHPLLKMAIAHYQFEAIHPFTDGNGRTGRILNMLILIQDKVLTHPILYLSKYIIDNKDDYYFLLNSVSSRNNWEGWLKYMLKAVKETSDYTIHLIEEIMDQFDSTRKFVEKTLPKIDYFVIESIFAQPYIKAVNITGDKIKSRNTAKKYLDQLCEIKVLELKNIGNETVYINTGLMKILEGEA